MTRSWAANRRSSSPEPEPTGDKIRGSASQSWPSSRGARTSLVAASALHYNASTRGSVTTSTPNGVRDPALLRLSAPAVDRPTTGVRLRSMRREVTRYEWANPVEGIHVDIEKLDRIPDGGGHKVLGRALDSGPGDAGWAAGTSTTPSMTAHACPGGQWSHLPHYRVRRRHLHRRLRLRHPHPSGFRRSGRFGPRSQG
jgi:hypothetical protein